MKFAIRDDDTSYFTCPSDLEKAYDFIEEGIISLSVVPNTVPNHKDDVFPYGEGIEYKKYNILENQELITHLRTHINKRYNVLLHGYSHEYRYTGKHWEPELIWKDIDTIRSQLIKGKELLEKILDTKIDVLVAPNNAIDKKAIQVAEELKMNFSGIIYFNDRKITMSYINNFMKRWIVRTLKGIPYPGVLNYKKHKELVAYPLDNIDRLIKEYMECRKKNQPFVIYTHYWNINQNQKQKELLKEIYQYAINDGAKLVGLSECF